MDTIFVIVVLALLLAWMLAIRIKAGPDAVQSRDGSPLSRGTHGLMPVVAAGSDVKGGPTVDVVAVMTSKTRDGSRAPGAAMASVRTAPHPEFHGAPGRRSSTVRTWVL